LIVFLLLGGLVVYIATRFFRDPFGSNLEDFVKLAGVGVTLVAALITGAISAINMFVQLRTAKELELLKPLLALEYPAFVGLNNAALLYYDTFNRLNSGNYDPNLAETAGVEMKKSNGVLWFMSDEYQTAWYTYWTQARNMKEALSNELKDASFNQKEYWSRHGRELNNLLESLRQATPRRKQ
jgi:hypothetical protein